MAAIAIMLVGVCCMSSSVGGTAFGLGFIPGTLPKLVSDLKLNELKKALKYGKDLLPEFNAKVTNASASSQDERLEFIDSIDDAKCQDIKTRSENMFKHMVENEPPEEVLTLSGMKPTDTAIYEFLEMPRTEFIAIGTMCEGALQPHARGEGDGEGEGESEE